MSSDTENGMRRIRMIPGNRIEKRYFWDSIKKVGEGLIGGAADLILGSVGGIFGHERDMDASAWSHRANMAAYGSRYQSTAADMRKAGLNPILAMTGGFNVGSAPQVRVPSFTNPGAMQPSASSALQMEQTNTEENKQELLKNQAKESFDRAANIRRQTKKMTKEEAKLVQEINNISQDTKNKMLEYGMYTVKQQHMDEQRRYFANQSKEILQRLHRLRNISELYGNAYGNWLIYMKETFKALPGFSYLIKESSGATVPIKGGK